MVSSIKNYLLRQEIKNTSKTAKQFVAWDKVQSAVILVESNQLQMVKEFVNQSVKNFDIVVFYNDKLSEAKECFLSVNKKDFTFFGLPKPECSKKIKGKTFDILINTDFNNTAQIRALTGLIQAKCKVGPENSNYSNFFDICLQSNQTEFLKQALKYLMMIKS